MTQEDKDNIIYWFGYIAQIADDRMSATGQRMADAHALDKIKALAKDAQYYIKKIQERESNSSWHYQDKEDIYDSFDDWSYHRFACLMRDNTVEIFGGMCDETFDGIINKHIDCYNTSYDVDDIVCWIEFPRTENTK